MKKYLLNGGLIVAGTFIIFARVFPIDESVPEIDYAALGEKITVGAIRWDAWIGTNGHDRTKTGLQVERSLSPWRYHYRAPFFSKEIGRDSIQIRQLTQDVMDQDISYARYAGINYWAFCYYPSVTGLDTGRRLYFSSKAKQGLKWCAILGVYYLFTDDDMKELVEKFKDNDYQKVLNGRPLVYIYGATHQFRYFQVAKLQELAKAAKVERPYFVLMSDDYKNPANNKEGITPDAISRYAIWDGDGNGTPYYPTIPNADKKAWDVLKATGIPVVPCVTTGRNMKPRIDNPVSWQKISVDHWIADGTPEQIAENLNNAIKWLNQNAVFAPANTVIIYAWNEFDEGGWLAPTLGHTPGKIDSGRIKAIRKVLIHN